MLVLKRLPNWPELLARYVESKANEPFVWGANDCCSFAINAVERITGTQVMPVTWDSEEAAYAVIDAMGGVVTKCTELFGQPSTNYRAIRRGDIALCPHSNMQSIMVCTGTSVCGPALDRLGFFPLHRVEMHWKIGA